MHQRYIYMHMRTTLNIDESLLRHAAKLTGVKEKTSLVRLGLEALISRESARCLAALGGTEKGSDLSEGDALAAWHEIGRHVRLGSGSPHWE